jgi:hypothetical protein
MTEMLIVWYVESLLLSVPLPMLTLYLLHCSGENWRSSALFRAVLALFFCFLLILVYAQSNPQFYYMTEDHTLAIGPWYPLAIVPLDTIMLLNLAGLARRRSMLSQRYFHAFLVFLLPLTAALLFHTVKPDFLVLDIGFILFGLSMFGLILCDQVADHLQQQRQIAHQQSSIMILQMRPHFIYNTMTSIYYLCKLDPEKAQTITMDFTTYLRKNLSAIASEEPIPFTQELEHTRAYLSVEQAQYEDKLFVEYDTPHTLFKLPPLTLQPVVENAVKHGMDPEADSLSIYIRSVEVDGHSLLTVEDNGTGFVPAEDNEPHIALENIRQRLEMMCNGKLTIEPREGGGTVVTIWIP